MTEKADDRIEERLAAMTHWEGERTALWRAALDDAQRADHTSRFSLKQFFSLPVSRVVAVVVILFGLGTTAALLLPKLKRAEDHASVRQLGIARVPPARSLMPPRPPYLAHGSGSSGGHGMGIDAGGRPTSGNLAGVSAGAGAFDEDARHVVRKATIEILTDDVRAVFLKAGQLTSEAMGEFVESSSLSGSGEEARASMTLRVAVDRLSAVLNDLRRLGTVRSEESHGEDVTTRAVDLEARSRNERRIEAELLELVQKREDAPLKELLELRRRLNEVRESIETLTAHRERLDRLVALATVLVIIRPQDAPEEGPQAGLGRYFSEKIGGAWAGGLRFLADSIGVGLRVLVGGMMWWLLLGVAALGLRQHRRQVRQGQAGAGRASAA